jgi:ankyrin repeat protein
MSSFVFILFPVLISMAQEGNKLIEAVMYQDLASVKTLINQGVDVNFKDQQSGSTALIIAANFGFSEIAEFLIDNGADINLQANNGTSPLMAAAGSSEQIFKLLLGKGADITLKNATGTTAFTSSLTGILRGRVTISIPEMLLEKGANVDEAPDKGPAKGYTGLMMAARNNHSDLVKFLVDKNADIQAVAHDGSTALSLAGKEGNEQMITLLKSLGAKN